MVLLVGQLRPLIHDFQISCVTENPIALAGGQFTDNPQPLQMFQGFVDRGRRDTCFFHQPLGSRDWTTYQGLMHLQG